MSDAHAEGHWTHDQRVQEIERLAKVLAAQIGCTCPMIYSRGGHPHDADCAREHVLRLLITGLIFWDGYLAWLSMSQVARTLAEDVAAQFQPDDLEGKLARSAMGYARWKAGMA